jgi:hypothetical protein
MADGGEGMLGAVAVACVAADCAGAAGVPALLVSGGIDATSIDELNSCFLACHAVSDPLMPLAEAMANTAALVERAMPRDHSVAYERHLGQMKGFAHLI